MKSALRGSRKREAGQTRIPAKCRTSLQKTKLTEVHISYISACTFCGPRSRLGEQNPLNNCVRQGSEQERVTRVHLWTNQRSDCVMHMDTEAQMFLILEEFFPPSRLAWVFSFLFEQRLQGANRSRPPKTLFLNFNFSRCGHVPEQSEEDRLWCSFEFRVNLLRPEGPFKNLEKVPSLKSQVAPKQIEFKKTNQGFRLLF